jgi:hypothetical protein
VLIQTGHDDGYIGLPLLAYLHVPDFVPDRDLEIGTLYVTSVLTRKGGLHYTQAVANRRAINNLYQRGLMHITICPTTYRVSDEKYDVIKVREFVSITFDGLEALDA